MPSQELNVDDLPDSFASWLAAIPTAPGSLGWRAAAASLLESAAFKPGNVHPAAGFDDLQHDDFMAAALAIARPFNTLQQPDSHRGEPQPLGRVILAAVTAAATATRSNANLGIVLAMAPLAAAALPLEEHLPQVLASLDSSDAETIWRAIAIAQPGGLGRVAEHDLAGPPPCIHHFGVEVDDVDAFTVALIAAGGEVVSEPGKLPVKFRAPGQTTMHHCFLVMLVSREW